MSILNDLELEFSPEIMSIIYGSILGDAHVERRSYNTKNGPKLGNTRITFKQGSRNVQYLIHNFNIFSTAELCTKKQPRLRTYIGKNNKAYYSLRFNTFTFNSFNDIHDMFYKEKVKILPCYFILEQIINPLALATWIMDDGSLENSGGMLLHTCNFSKNEVERLRSLLFKKFNIKTNLRNKQGKY
jgi:hypothetical protein